MPSNLLALFGPDTLGVFIPIMALMIPMVVILTRHQQRMAEIIHANGGVNEVNDLRREVADLRSMVQRQSLAIDQLNHLQAISSSESGLADRLRIDNQR